MSLFVNLLLGSILAVLLVFAAVRGRVVLVQGLREAGVDFLRLLPRLALGVIGSGFIAETVPQGLIVQWLGPESGVLGLGIATVAGALTPGGPVVGFAIGAAALKGGAAMPQVIAYSTAWALFALHRLLVWEVPLMPPRLVWLRALVSLPLPFLAAAGAILIGRP
jgi:uncharacterized membrane protein YraQ (UPF0718 family)